METTDLRDKAREALLAMTEGPEGPRPEEAAALYAIGCALIAIADELKRMNDLEARNPARA